MATEQFAGPVDYLVFRFPAGASVGAGLKAVLDQVDAGAIEVLDLEVITRSSEGKAHTIALTDLQGAADIDLAVFEGVDSGILDADDIAAIADALDPGDFALALVYEDRSLAQAAAAWASTGGTELVSGGVAIEDLEQTITEGNAS